MSSDNQPDNNQAHQQPRKGRSPVVSSVISSVVGGAILGAFAITAAFLLGVIDRQTSAQIACNKEALLIDRLSQVLPRESFNNDLLNDSILLDIGLAEPITVYRARNNGKPVAAIFSSYTPKGYSGRIELLISINTARQITGVRATQHRETPGLGDKIEADRNPWILQFAGLSLDNPTTKQWAVKKDGGQFDQFTGATITPRAVVAAIKLALENFGEQQKKIFALPAIQSDQDTNTATTPTTTDLECNH